MAYGEGFPAPEEQEVEFAVEEKSSEFVDAPKGSEENPFTRDEMVEKVGEEAVAKIENEAEKVEQPKTKKK